MTLNRLQPYTREALELLPSKELNGLVRAENNAGNLPAPLPGMHPGETVGVFISSRNCGSKENAIAILLGESAPAATPLPKPPFALSGGVAPTPKPPAASDDPAELFRRAIEAAGATTRGTMDETRIRELAHDETSKAMRNGAFPVDRVQAIVEEMLANLPARKVEVKIGDKTHTVSGLRHFQFMQALTWIANGVPLWLWGGAGAGKSHLAKQLGGALGVPAYVVPIDPTTTVGKLLGFRNLATGDFVEGALYKAYKNGGLLCLDECDAGDAGILAALNSLLANESYLFPNGETVARHAEFYVMSGANTKGTGAVGWYKARTVLDGATLDRFAVVELSYDEPLEMALACQSDVENARPEWTPGKPATAAQVKAWVAWVQKVRGTVGNALLISPRASMNGAKALRAGIPAKEVAEALVFKLASDETRKAIVARCGDPAAI